MAARRFAEVFRCVQNACKWQYSDGSPLLSVSGHLLGLLHGCCTDVVVCIRIKSGKVVIRLAAWSSLMRASCQVISTAVDVFRRERSGCGRESHTRLQGTLE